MLNNRKFLKIMSIILIIFGGIGVISSLLLVFIGSSAVQAAGATITTGQIVLSVVIALLELTAGIVGVIRKNAMLAMILGAGYLVLSLVSIFMAGFQLTSLVSLIIPILYLWAVYQAKE